MYRIRFHRVDEPDPRSVLAASDDLSPDDRTEIQRRLDRLDRASTTGPWTRAVLETIAARPATRAADLAESFGRETLPFKTDVRKLKNLGLTESLEVGYRLSPRAWRSCRRAGSGGRPRDRCRADAARTRERLRASMLPYWLEASRDDVAGGFLLHDDVRRGPVRKVGRVLLRGRRPAPSDHKQLVTQARLVWVFAHVAPEGVRRRHRVPRGRGTGPALPARALP